MVLKLKIRNKFAVFQLDSCQTGLCKIIDIRYLLLIKFELMLNILCYSFDDLVVGS